ncbi:MAG: hypothetical protein ACLRYB_17650 [Segatella copri]
MNGTATMPSYFPCIKSSESHPLADWLYLKSVITSSPELRMMTETYRKRLAISKQFADQYKPEMPAITVSALMNGYGRQLADFLKPTYMLQLDFDHVKKEDMEQAYPTGERRQSYDGRVYHRERQGIQSILRLPSCG